MIKYSNDFIECYKCTTCYPIELMVLIDGKFYCSLCAIKVDTTTAKNHPDEVD
jgi:hypothetical protein